MKQVALAGLLFAASLAVADERILEFNSDITVDADRSLLVSETITVRAEGNRIRRGIYRDFPTEYRDRYGNSVTVRYEPLGVLRNDQPEDFHTDPLRNGVRTYFGSADRYLEPGVHSYQFRYRVERVLGYFENHDELYWNVTGLDWAFPIDRAAASVELRFSRPAQILEADAWTGPAGGRGDEYVVRIDDDRAAFETTRALAAHEGLTIVVTWPKGHVEAPGDLERLGWLLADNANLLVLAVGAMLMLAYLIPVWNAFGRDPEEGLIVTRYEPPADLTPASLRYIRQMYYDNKVMTAAVVSLAVKGCLRIEESGGDYELIRARPATPPVLPESERALYEKLFREGDRLELDDQYHERISGARKAHRDALRREFRGRYFRTNGLLNLPALAIGIATAVIALGISRPTPFVIGGLVLLVVVFAFFAWIMKRPTVLGRKALDEILGFRDYLDIAEKDELNLRHPPEKTPGLFEKYLPYALALDVEHNWAERFASVLAGVRAGDGGSWHPAWYSGHWNSVDLSGTTSAMSKSLGSAISSSATPPGSSSGSGGGGFSGGGGGGGGGGGW